MSNAEGALILETAISVAALAILIWVVRILLPAAARQDDRFAQLCALRLLRSREGLGDYEVPAANYGVQAGEALRVECASGRPVGIVKR